MNHNEKIAQLQAEIAQHQKAMENCKHDWKDAVYDPETVKEPYGSRQVGKGSDPWWEPEGYRDIQKDRWSRECKCCGKKEYTYTQETVEVKKKPKF